MITLTSGTRTNCHKSVLILSFQGHKSPPAPLAMNIVDWAVSGAAEQPID
jgi:hypothetical protein